MQKLVLCLALLSFLGFWCQAGKPVHEVPKNETNTEPATSDSKYAKCEVATFPEPSCCGLQISQEGLNGRIYGGRETKIHEFPWLVYIDVRQILVNGVPDFCAGSLINTRWVLSAAHCFVNPKIHLPHTITLRFGEWNLDTEEDCEYDGRCAPPIVTVDIDKVFPHGDYNPLDNKHSNDIALIRLRETIHYTDFIQPICLHWDGLLDHSELIGHVAEVAGWGSTEFNDKENAIKMKVKIKVRETKDCSNSSDHGGVFLDYLIRSDKDPAEKSFTNNQICAGGNEGVSSCLGDLGGPLMMKLHTSQLGHGANDSSPYYQIGLVSHSEHCGNGEEPGIYTRISYYLKWIREIIRRNPPKRNLHKKP